MRHLRGGPKNRLYTFPSRSRHPHTLFERSNESARFPGQDRRSGSARRFSRCNSFDAPSVLIGLAQNGWSAALDFIVSPDRADNATRRRWRPRFGGRRMTAGPLGDTRTGRMTADHSPWAPARETRGAPSRSVGRRTNQKGCSPPVALVSRSRCDRSIISARPARYRINVKGRYRKSQCRKMSRLVTAGH